MGVIDRLAMLTGSDFASVMLEVVRRRAARETPASVLRRYRHDRSSGRAAPRGGPPGGPRTFCSAACPRT